MKTIPVIAIHAIYGEAATGELWDCPEDDFDSMHAGGHVVTLEEAQSKGIGNVDDSLVASLKEGVGSGLGSDETARIKREVADQMRGDIEAQIRADERARIEKEAAAKVRDPNDPPEPPEGATDGQAPQGDGTAAPSLV